VPADTQNAASDTGFPDPESVDIDALFAALREEVRRSGADPGGGGDPGDRRAARDEAERLWPVSADRSLRLRPGVRGGIGTPVKAVLRKMMRWYVEPLAAERFALIVSNPPYVAAGDPHLAQGDLRFEPRAALVAGADGLDAIRAIARGAPRHLIPGAWLLLEHGMGQERAVRDLLAEAGLEAISTWPDLAGIARVTGGRLKSE